MKAPFKVPDSRPSFVVILGVMATSIFFITAGKSHAASPITPSGSASQPLTLAAGKTQYNITG